MASIRESREALLDAVEDLLARVEILESGDQPVGAAAKATKKVKR